MSNFASAYASIGYTTMRNKLHLNLSDGNRPQCGQGAIKEWIAIQAIRTALDKNKAIGEATQEARRVEPTADLCARCFKAVAA